MNRSGSFSAAWSYFRDPNSFVAVNARRSFPFRYPRERSPISAVAVVAVFTIVERTYLSEAPSRNVLNVWAPPRLSTRSLGVKEEVSLPELSAPVNVPWVSEWRLTAKALESPTFLVGREASLLWIPRRSHA